MGALIQLNGVTQRRVVVAYGSTVSLQNAAPAGSSQKWEILDYPTDLDDTGPDAATNLAAWSLAGDGTYFINQSSGPFGSVTFKPDVTGTYLVKLTSNEGATVVQTAIVRVVEVHSGEHLPAAGETTEDDTRQGHKKILNLRLKRMAKRMQGYVRVANVTGSPIVRGKVVKLTATVDAHTISPATNPGGTTAAKGEKVYTITVADNTAAGAANGDYAILDETLSSNQVGWAQKFGLFEGKADVNYTSFTANNRIYFDNAGNQVNTPPGTGAAIPVGTLLENGSAGSLSVALAGVSVNELITGKAGGNAIVFGTGAGDSGTVTSTSNATKGTVTFGSPTAIMVINENRTVDSAVGVLDTVKLPSVSITLTGNTNITTTSGFNYFAINPPSVSAASAVAITHCATVYIGGPPVLAGAGPASATNLSAVRIDGTWSNTTGTGRGLRQTTTFAPASGAGAFVAEEISYTINQTGGANGAVTGLLINGTETALGGTHTLIDVQVAGSSKFKVTNAGPLVNVATTLDLTGLTTTVPLTVKNAKTGSGIEVQVTGTVSSGYSLVNSSGTTKGGLHLVATTNDEITGSAAGDITITGDSSKKLLLGALSGSAAMITVDLSNGLVGVNATPSVTRLDVADPGTANNCARFKATSTSGNANVAIFGSANQGFNISAYGGSAAGNLFGVAVASSAFIRANSVCNFFALGSDNTAPVILGTNNVERMRVDGSGNVSIGTAALATNATDGFLYITTCAGTPTGTPAAKTGRVPMIYDTMNNKFYVYNGAWKGGTAPGVWS